MSDIRASVAVAGLTKRYGRTVAVDNLSFEVKSGAVTGFLGPNGAGKTTTLKMILGLARPTAGHALINGKRYGELKTPWRVVGSMLETQRAHPRRSAYHHLRWLALSNGIARNRIDEVLGRVGLESVAGKKVGTFSLGMTQRLGIATALLGDPEVLLFDEPTNGLDPQGILWARQLMQSLAAEGRAVLMSSHLMAETALAAEYVVVIGHGELLADCTVTEFVTRGAPVAALVRSPEPDALKAVAAGAGLEVAVLDGSQLRVSGVNAEEVGKLAAAAGLPVHELLDERRTLEEAFIAATAGHARFVAENRKESR